RDGRGQHRIRTGDVRYEPGRGLQPGTEGSESRWKESYTWDSPKIVGRTAYDQAASFSMPWRMMKSITVSKPSPVLRLVKTKGRSPRIRRESRSITSSEAPTWGARSVLLMISRSDLVMPGPP